MDGRELLLAGLLVLLLTPIVTTDVAERRIPNAWVAMLAVAGLAGRLWLSPHWSTLGYELLAAVLTAGLFLALIGATRLLKRQGTLGMGDVKFMIAASLWVGFLGGAAVFVAASLLAFVWALALSPWRKLDLTRPLAFAPALSAALLGLFLLSAAG
jgi:leader peptidase (prepilin peptidase)/N-methyltransferase